MQRPVLVVHGGAGSRSDTADAARQSGCAAAVAAGWQVLAKGGSAVDAVVATVVVLEDDPLFNAGVGSSLTVSGRVEMDASLMDGQTLTAGAAAAVTRVRNPIRLAQAIMQDGGHVMMVGPGAETFAIEHALPTEDPASFVTTRQHLLWESRGSGTPGTVGAIALDVDGHTAAATSTGGRMFKRDGRVGDSAVIGAGTYADDTLGAASATGTGEVIMRFVLAKTATDRLRDGRDPQSVAEHVVTELTRRFGGEAGIILLDRFGRVGIARNTPYMVTACRSERTGVSMTN